MTRTIPLALVLPLAVLPASGVSRLVQETQPAKGGASAVDPKSLIEAALADHRARDLGSDGSRVGSVTHDFEIPAPTGFRLSTPILTDAVARC